MDDLPRYGLLSTNYADDLADPRWLVPLDWEPREPVESPQRIAAWIKWRDSLVSKLDELIWPAYGRDTDETHPSRIERRIAITVADLHLMIADFLPRFNASVLLPAGIDERLHWEFYESEDRVDGQSDMADTLSFYAPRLAAMLGKLAIGSMASGRDRTLGSLILYLKKVFERPRAYQCSVLLNITDGYTHELALTGSTPSFISGHCLQALMSVAYFYDRLTRCGEALSTTEIDSLQQYAADIGDRRVFAGVHYPSDSLGSWLTALLLARHVFPSASTEPARLFLVGAIKRSAVYRVLAYTSEESFRRPMAILERMMRD